MLLVDFDAPSNLRALARFDKGRLEAASQAGGDLLGHGHMAFTIDPGGDMNRYQGVIALEGQGLEAAAHHYFERSEQIPTLVRLAVGEIVTAGGAAWRAGGLVVQYLPNEGGRRLQADFPPGDAPEGVEPHTIAEDDAWTEAKSRAATTEAHELIDPTLSGERLLFRLFNERGVRVYEPTPLAAVCRCSAEGVDAMLRSLSAGRGQGDGGRRRHDRRHLRILLDQAHLQPRRLRRVRTEAAPMDDSAFAARLAESQGSIERELEILLEP